tara:strand:- start:5278 stop:6543 length:1266 start_codon:yes stop_codon:yes gene_type:complete
MMDDVVGLVMVQVISNLGGDNFSWVTVVRPVLVSAAFAVVTPFVCRLLVRPVTIWLNQYRDAHPLTKLASVLQNPRTALVIHTLLLLAIITSATYAGTSNLFAAYIAGAGISWWDSEVPHPLATGATSGTLQTQEVKLVPAPRSSSTGQPSGGIQDANRRASEVLQAGEDGPSTSALKRVDGPHHNTDTCGSTIYTRYYHPAVSTILQPLFFASVGFSIPITRMFAGSIVWRGIVYTVLMAFAKFVCGLWLVRFSTDSRSGRVVISQLLTKVRIPSVPHLWGKRERPGTSPEESAPNPAPAAASTTALASEASSRRSSTNPPKPVSLHPPLILALAMCARGEIGFLISGVAESNGVFSASGQATDEPTDIFLVVTWAIVLCTIVGPLGVGLSVRRVKNLQERKSKQQEGAGRDVLGVWGVS